MVTCCVFSYIETRNGYLLRLRCIAPAIRKPLFQCEGNIIAQWLEM
jgi:hypothetical protein